MAKTTTVWAAGSLLAGAVWVTRKDPWWKSFGQQHIGWGLVDLGIVVVVQGLQRRAMGRLPEPYDAAVLERRRRHLHKIMLGNAIADAGYVLTGAVMCRKLRHKPRGAGAGAAIVVQGAFLMVHDAYHARLSATPKVDR